MTVPVKAASSFHTVAGDTFSPIGNSIVLDAPSTESESESLFLMVVVAFVAMWFHGVVIEATSGLRPTHATNFFSRKM